MPRRRDEYLVSADLGTAITRAAVACWRADGDLVLEGYAETPTRGVAKGIIVDAAEAAESLRQAVEEAANLARVRVYTVLAAVATPFARGVNSRGCIGIAHEDKLVRGADAAQALAAASRVSLPGDRVVAEVYSQGFMVDEVRNVRNPVGMACGRLEAELHVVSDSLSAHANVRQAARKAGVHLEHAIFAPLAAAEAVLSPEEKRLGSAHVDIGAAKTSVSVYFAGYPRYSRVLPIGAQHITNDLAIGLNIPVAEAEQLKRRCGAADVRRPRGGDVGEKIDVALANGGGIQAVPLWRIGLIVRARVEELFEMVGKELDRSGVAAAAAGCGRVVLTGGFCRMTRALAAAHRALRRPVRLGRVEMGCLLPQFELDPTHAVVLGALFRGMHHREQRLDHRFEERGLRTVFKRVAGWL
ncbi:MAG TPA: cell division protein FtsA [Planctomycetota bacterium]|nr:cell division protein FtsA [Planctomycetota bacterium]